jgi:hypothetical protein
MHSLDDATKLLEGSTLVLYTNGNVTVQVPCDPRGFIWTSLPQPYRKCILVKTSHSCIEINWNLQLKIHTKFIVTLREFYILLWRMRNYFLYK